MALHIAVCDDNAADRKQLERLLLRENDERKKNGCTIYVDSFGNREALMKTPLKYNLFLIADNDCYTASIPQSSDTSSLSKPVLREELSKLLTLAMEKNQIKTPLIEIRGEKETYFITEPELVCAKQKEHLVEITLANGSFIYMLGTTKALAVLLQAYHSFLLYKQVIINLSHVTSIKNNSLILTNGENIPFSIFSRSKILHACQEFQNQSEN